MISPRVLNYHSFPFLCVCHSISRWCIVSFCLSVNLVESIQYMFWFACFCLGTSCPALCLSFHSLGACGCSSFSLLSGFLFMNKPESIYSATGRHLICSLICVSPAVASSFEKLLVPMCRFVLEHNSDSWSI